MRLLLTTVTAAGLAACASPTAYEAASGPSDNTGYASSQLTNDTYRVSFEGNDVTSRQTVETYLLYRAAQIAQNTGNEYFRFVSRDTDQQIDLDAYRTYDTSPGLYGYGFGNYGYSYYSTFPYGTATGLSPYSQTTVTTDDSYEAQAVIEVFEDRPSDMQNVMDAGDVIARLRPEIERPEGSDEGGIL